MSRPSRLASGSLILLSGLFAGVVLPLVAPAYYLHLATEVLVLGLLATAFNLLFGGTGLLSFGQAAFFATGAYAAAFVLKGIIASMPLALLAGLLAGAAASFIVGVLSVRRNEIYFAMLTLAFGQLFSVVFLQAYHITGGADGIAGVPRPRLGSTAFGVNLAPTLNYYLFTLVVVAAALWTLWRVSRSPLGLTLAAIRENPSRTAYLGIATRRYRLAAFTIAGAFSGLAGALFAPFQGTVVPDFANWVMSAEPVLMTLLGGAGPFFGPLLGAAFFVALKDTIGSWTEYWPLVLGTIVILLILFLPEGPIGLINRVLTLGCREAVTRVPIAAAEDGT
jgi:branched-chain amino acid transport system permease protein